MSQDGKRLTAHIGGASGARFEIAVADPPPAAEPNPPMRAKASRNSQKLVARTPAKTKRLLLTVQLVPDSEKPAQQRIELLKDWK
jgi:hypothetical protein